MPAGLNLFYYPNQLEITKLINDSRRRLEIIRNMPTNKSIASSIFDRVSSRSSFLSVKDYKATVQLLDDNETIFQEFKRGSNAQMVLDYVCDFLNIVEKDYFGLRYQDSSRHRYWVDLNKPISKQIRGDNIAVRFRVRYYPTNPAHLKEEITRYYLFAQLQRDLLHGRLFCPQHDAVVLAALILQSLIGDYDPKIHTEGYVSEYKLMLKQTEKVEEKIAEEHQKFKGLSAAQAELEFLKRASELDTYGFDPFPVKESKDGRMLYIGVTYKGVYVYCDNIMVHHMNWNDIEKVDYLGKELFLTPTASYLGHNSSSLNTSNKLITNNKSPEAKILTLREDLSTKNAKSSALKYHCPSATFAKHLWRHILSQRAFFNENDAKHIKPIFSKPRFPLLSRGSSFHFPASRVLHEIETDEEVRRNGPEPQFNRYPLKRQPPRQQLVRGSPLYNTLPAVHIRNFNQTIPEEGPILESQEKEEQEENKALSESVPEASSSSSLPNEETKMTSVTVHLCQSEPIPSTTAIKKDEKKDGYVPSAVSDFGIASVSLLNDEISRGNLSEELPSTSSQQEKVPLNLSTDSSQIQCQKAKNRGLSICSSVFFTFLILLLFISAIVALLENSSSWIDSYPFVDSMRDSYYEPLRNVLVAKYERFFNTYFRF